MCLLPWLCPTTWFSGPSLSHSFVAYSPFFPDFWPCFLPSPLDSVERVAGKSLHQSICPPSLPTQVPGGRFCVGPHSASPTGAPRYVDGNWPVWLCGVSSKDRFSSWCGVRFGRGSSCSPWNLWNLLSLSPPTQTCWKWPTGSKAFGKGTGEWVGWWLKVGCLGVVLLLCAGIYF